MAEDTDRGHAPVFLCLRLSDGLQVLETWTLFLLFADFSELLLFYARPLCREGLWGKPLIEN